MILLVVWSVNGISKANSKVDLLIRRYLPIGLCDCNCVILRKNKVRYALDKEILDILNKAFLEKAVVELVYKFDQKYYANV